MIRFADSIYLSPSRYHVHRVAGSQFAGNLVSFVILPSATSLHVSDRVKHAIDSYEYPGPHSTSTSSIFILVHEVCFGTDEREVRPAAPGK